MKLKDGPQAVVSHASGLGRKIGTEYLDVISRASAARKRRALVSELGDVVIAKFEADPGPLSYEEVEELLKQIKGLTTREEE